MSNAVMEQMPQGRVIGRVTAQRRPNLRFRLLAGTHVEDESIYEDFEVDVNGRTEKRRRLMGEARQHIYTRGDVIETDLNLSEMYDKPGNPPRFQPLVEGGLYEPLVGTKDWFQPINGETQDQFKARMSDLIRKAQVAQLSEEELGMTFQGMDVKELVRHAEEEEIDLKGVNRQDKKALTQAIVSARKARGGR